MQTSTKLVYLMAGIISAISLVSGRAQAQDVKQLVVAVCSKCHGTDGNSTLPRYPKLAGQSKEYLTVQLKAFRDQTRKDFDAHAFMWEPSKTLTDEMISQLGDYFAAQKPAPGKPGNAKLAEKGKVIYERGIESKRVPACAFCHGQQAQGTSKIPRLAGQHAAYLVRQLKVFHGNYRPGLSVTMKAVVERLSDEEAEQVAAYLQGL